MTPTTDLCAFAIQTSGPNTFTDTIIEAAAVKFDRDSGHVLARYSSLMRGRSLVGLDLSHSRDISIEDMQGAPFASTELPKFREFLAFGRDVTLIGHDMQRSKFFLWAAFGTHGHAGLPKLDHDTIDTMKLAKGHHPGWPSYTMPTLADRFGISGEGGYRALAEAERVRTLWMWLSRERMAG